MIYSKHFTYKGITIIFDKLETNKEYPTQYIALRGENQKPVVFIPQLEIKVINTLSIGENLKIITFSYTE